MITLKTLPTATPQEVFDHVVNHLFVQGKQSLYYAPDEFPCCMYRNPEGLKCAAGCLIADEEYDKSFERRPWQDLIDKGLVPKEHHELIKILQDIHDNDLDFKHYKESLNNLLSLVATQFNLNFTTRF